MTTHQPLTRQGNIHSRGLWSVPFPREGGQWRWGTTPCPQLSCVPTGKPDRENNGTLQAILRFHVNTGRHCPYPLSKRHGPRNPQQRVVPLRAQIPQPRRWPNVHGGKGRNPHQRGSPQHLTNYIGRHIHQCENNHFNATNGNQTRTPTATHCNSTCATHH